MGSEFCSKSKELHKSNFAWTGPDPPEDPDLDPNSIFLIVDCTVINKSLYGKSFSLSNYSAINPLKIQFGLSIKIADCWNNPDPFPDLSFQADPDFSNNRRFLEQSGSCGGSSLLTDPDYWAGSEFSKQPSILEQSGSYGGSSLLTDPE